MTHARSKPKRNKSIEQHFFAGALRAAHGDRELLVEAFKAHKHDPDPYSLWMRFEAAGRANALTHTGSDLSNVVFEMEE